MEQREAASHMGLSLVLVRALEQDAFQQLGAPVFVRGYLSRYARLLGLPEQEILERYKRLGLDQPPPLRVERSAKLKAKVSDTGVRWFSYLLVLAVVGWLGWLGWQQFSTRLETSEVTVAQDSGTQGNIALPRPEFPDSKGNSEPGKAASPAPSPPGVAESGSTPATPSPPVNTVVPAQPAMSEPAVTPAAAANPELVLEFAQDCWVDIKDANGNRIAYGIMKAKTVNTYSAPAPFSMILGSSGSVHIKLNGQVIDPATYVKRGGVSRFVLDIPRGG